MRSFRSSNRRDFSQWIGLGQLFCLFSILFSGTLVYSQETDVTQTPNSENAGIQKSLSEQIGAGRGAPDFTTPDSSLYIINRDPFRSIRRGRNLFQRKFTVVQGFGPRTGDGEGNI